MESPQKHLAHTDKGQGSSPAAFGVLPHKFTFSACRQLSHDHIVMVVDRVSLLITYTATTLI